MNSQATQRSEANSQRGLIEPGPAALVAALACSTLLVLLTRMPVARLGPMETDEFGFVQQIRAHWFPMHHTLFLTAARLVSVLTGDEYGGILVLDMAMSVLALVSLWWWLRALVSPSTALAGTLVIAAAPVFWGYGAMAGNYTAILAVGAFLLGLVCRTWKQPRAWHPHAAAIVLALGTGYRQDIGTFWLPLFLVILWSHRWQRAFLAALLFAVINLAWLVPMLYEAGGWARYRAQSADFAYHAGYLNSVWNLGVVDAPLRYAVKLGMALVWTLGPCLFFVPRGIRRLYRSERGGLILVVLALSVIPPLASHLLIHFGVPGYGFHYVPALLALSVLGIGAVDVGTANSDVSGGFAFVPGAGPWRLSLVAIALAAVFLFYPTDYEQPGWRASFDQSFARLTRVGLQRPLPNHQPELWRTANSHASAERR